METLLLCLSLFSAAFLAATILPFSSEAALSAALLGGVPAAVSLIAATAGNVLGSMTTFYLGRLGRLEWLEKYCRISGEELEKAQKRIGRYGFLAAFLVFVPVIGDGFAAALGYMRYPVLRFLCFMTAGKLFRYAVWICFHQAILE